MIPIATKDRVKVRVRVCVRVRVRVCVKVRVRMKVRVRVMVRGRIRVRVWVRVRVRFSAIPSFEKLKKRARGNSDVELKNCTGQSQRQYRAEGSV